MSPTHSLRILSSVAIIARESSLQTHRRSADPCGQRNATVFNSRVTVHRIVRLVANSAFTRFGINFDDQVRIVIFGCPNSEIPASRDLLEPDENIGILGKPLEK